MNYEEFERIITEQADLADKILEIISDDLDEINEDLQFVAGLSTIATVLDTFCIIHGQDPVKAKKQLAELGENVEANVIAAMKEKQCQFI